MSEMLYGNTGKRDEGINIDMEQSLYQKLQSVAFVPKLKKMLNDTLQSEDRNFIFIGEVQDKAGNFSVFGYNAKLENDTRGGDYGHYIAVPVSDKVVSADFSNIKFLTEEGFIEYIYDKTLNNEKKFSLGNQPVEIDINVKKQIVNNLMEAFTKSRKRKNVTVSLDESDIQVFSEKSVSLLLDIMKYIPYAMRKNISFISHVNSIEKLPEMINLAVYSDSCANKPRECISLSSTSYASVDGMFAGYVEKVFSMNDAEREAYFANIYNVIEHPAIERGIAVKSDLYLLDISTKELWERGDAKEAIRSIFASTDDVLKIYPEYLQIAKQTLKINNAETFEYVKAQVANAQNTDELKLTYFNIRSLFEVCNFDFNKAVIPLVIEKSTELIEKTHNGETLISTVDAIKEFDENVLDKNSIYNKIAFILCNKCSLEEMYSIYLVFKTKEYIGESELDSCLGKAAENLILKETADLFTAKEKLSKLEKIYTEFRNAYQNGGFAPIQEVCAAYAKKFSSGVNEENIKDGNDILYSIEADLDQFSELWDIRGFIQKLAKIDVSSDSNLKREASVCYRKISDKLFKVLEYGNFTYADIEEFINTTAPSIRELNDKAIYDRELMGTAIPYDGIYRLVGLFYALINELKECSTLLDAVRAYELNTAKVEQHETQIKKLCAKYGQVIIAGWHEKHPKINIASGFDKAVTQLNKKEGISVTVETAESFKNSVKNVVKKKKSPIRLILVFVIVGVVLISGLAAGGIFIFTNMNTHSEEAEDGEFYIENETIDKIETYLNGFDKEGLGETTLIVGKFISSSPENITEPPVAETEENANEILTATEETPVDSNLQTEKMPNTGESNIDGQTPEDGIEIPVEETTKSYEIAITDSIELQTIDEKIVATYGGDNENSKNIFSVDNVNAEKNYLIVINEQVAEDGVRNYVIYDIFELPDNLETYAFRENYAEASEGGDETAVFCENLIQYVAYKQGILGTFGEEKDEATAIEEQKIV